MIKLSKNSELESGYILIQATKLDELKPITDMLIMATYKLSHRNLTHEAVYLDLPAASYHIVQGELSGYFLEIRLEDQRNLTPYTAIFSNT